MESGADVIYYECITSHPHLRQRGTSIEVSGNSRRTCSDCNILLMHYHLLLRQREQDNLDRGFQQSRLNWCECNTFPIYCQCITIWFFDIKARITSIEVSNNPRRSSSDQNTFLIHWECITTRTLDESTTKTPTCPFLFPAGALVLFASLHLIEAALHRQEPILHPPNPRPNPPSVRRSVTENKRPAARAADPTFTRLGCTAKTKRWKAHSKPKPPPFHLPLLAFPPILTTGRA